jgi:RimJ/RimL family protein N-acetyltransferase
MPGGVHIQTRRLRLRSWRAADRERFHAACNTPEVMRWLGGVQSRTQLRQDVAYFAAMEKREGFTFWVVERRSDKAFLGFVGLIRVEEEDCPFAGEVEIGWRLRQSVWRRGYGFEAASAVLDHAFVELKLERVVSRTAKRNAASVALMRKLGLKRCRKMDYRSVVAIAKLAVFTLTARQWAKQRGHRSRRR